MIVMCGIGGIWKRGGGSADHGELRRLMSAIAHRGPEGAAFGRLDGGSLLVGFLRLGFTAGGVCQQPLYNEDESIALVYNGEIYDFEALRSRLTRAGHVFRTTSDSEVIVHLFEEHGDAFLQHLNGEFAFAIWDARRSELVLVRDRFGVKPLFYAWHRGAFVFASEAKAILALEGFSAQLDPLHFTGAGVGLVETSRTPFLGIHTVRPGHLMRVGRSSVREEPYFELPFVESRVSEKWSMEDAARAVRSAVTNAVARRLDGDPPLAVSLSSGIDSTIVAGLAAENANRRGRRITAFSVGYTGAAYDESTAAERTASAFGMNFERVVCTHDQLADDFLDATHSIECTTNSLSATARIRLAKSVRARGLKALMSGEGSDELFGGYPYFGAEAIQRGLLAAGEKRRIAERAWDVFQQQESASRGIFWEGGKAWRSANTLFGFPSAYEIRARSVDRASSLLFARGFLGSMADVSPLTTLRREFDLARMRGLTPFDQTRTIARGMLGGVIIPGLGDRVEMAGSLEGRVPYLDVDVINVACSLPERLCIDPVTFTRKAVLRRAFADLIPRGFAPPAKTTLMAPSFADLARTKRGRELVEFLAGDAVVKRAGVFNPTFVRLLRAAWTLFPRSGRRHAQLDLAMGFVICTHALHHVLVEDGLKKRSQMGLLALSEDRSPLLMRAPQSTQSRREPIVYAVAQSGGVS
ncbi:MAG: asparagine synthase (glutamine-hydrolyzing) [Polyangiaceae bacterium]|nr:asparagine synthase (glutamine-hydrolyzing) [Polyangiaceae bacterium]